MNPDHPPGVPLSVALMLVGAVVCLGVLILIVVSVASNAFQKAQDRRWAREHVTRFEWLRINAGAWWAALVDSVRRERS